MYASGQQPSATDALQCQERGNVRAGESAAANFSQRNESFSYSKRCVGVAIAAVADAVNEDVGRAPKHTHTHTLQFGFLVVRLPVRE